MKSNGAVFALGAVGVLAAVGAARRRGRGSRWQSDPRVELYDESSPDSYDYDYVWEVHAQGRWEPAYSLSQSQSFHVFTDDENFDEADAQRAVDGYIGNEFLFGRPIDMDFKPGESISSLVKKPERKRRSLRGAR